MLAAEAIRLAAVEILLPTAALLAGGPYPTLAGRYVYDSRAVSVADLDRAAPYTPVLSLYTSESGVSLRGEAAAAWDTAADAVLDVVSELAIVAPDEGGEIADAMAGDDPSARLVLAALCAQVRRLLERSESGGLWRTLVRRIVKIENVTFALPEYGLRWQRIMTRYHLEIRDDDLDMSVAGLPEPIRSLHASLPDQSYAKAKLADLAAHFTAETVPPLAGVAVDTGPGVPGIVYP